MIAGTTSPHLSLRNCYMLGVDSGSLTLARQFSLVVLPD